MDGCFIVVLLYHIHRMGWRENCLISDSFFLTMKRDFVIEMSAPHDTNSTWLQYVHEDKINIPPWPPESTYHPGLLQIYPMISRTLFSLH